MLFFHILYWSHLVTVPFKDATVQFTVYYGFMLNWFCMSCQYWENIQRIHILTVNE